MSTSGKLVIVPTPIGNLGDMTLRSLEALRERFAARAEEPGGVRGEIALVIDAPGETEAVAGAEEAAASAAERAAELVAEGLRTKEVAKHLVAEFGISRNDAYNLAMEAAR